MEILQALLDVVEKWPDVRFGQLLTAMDVTALERDIFYDESTVILARVSASMERHGL